MRVFLIKGVLHLLALLPLPRVHAIATWLGRIISQQNRLRMTQVTRTNIQLCFPQLSLVEQDEFIKQSLIETCKTVTELGALWLWSPPQVLKQIRAVSNEIYLQQAMQTGQGVILLTPHLGAWEIAGLYVSAHYPLTALYRPPKLVGLDNFIRQARERAGGCFVATNQKGIRTMYQALHRGQVVGILPDQVPNEAAAGIFSPFFGVPAYTMVLVFRLVQKTGALVLFTYAERLSQGGGFHLHFQQASPMINSAQVEIAVRALNQGVEQCVQTCPSQYQWNYKRFKRHPNGEKSKSCYDR
ncbi:MAG: lysophospholipid acyltransferase family protein [Thioploca sp.]|nr:lysophospholipid acyltransferase family protein [Thioploca sp.]